MRAKPEVLEYFEKNGSLAIGNLTFNFQADGQTLNEIKPVEYIGK
jgi:hypothetical protein